MKKIMKKILIVSAVSSAVLALQACENGIGSAPSTDALMNPDYNYELDTWGSNSEVYEFTPKSNTNMSCVFVMLDNSKAMGLQCFKKYYNK